MDGEEDGVPRGTRDWWNLERTGVDPGAHLPDKRSGMVVVPL